MMSEKIERENERELNRDQIVSGLPGARRVRFNPKSKDLLQFVRDSFRTLERFETVSRLLEVSTAEADRVLAAQSLGSFGRRVARPNRRPGSEGGFVGGEQRP